MLHQLQLWIFISHNPSDVGMEAAFGIQRFLLQAEECTVQFLLAVVILQHW